MPDDLSEIRALEERAFNAWPALQTLLVDGWLMRFADGYTKRANSLNAWQPLASVETVLEHARGIYASRGLPLVIRISPLAGGDADAMLAARGFRLVDETIVMTAPLAQLAQLHDPAVTIATTREQAWSSGFSDANGIDPERRAIHDRLLDALPSPAAFATLTSGLDSIAWGLAVVERHYVGFFDIVTAPSARRQGAARRLVGSLLRWAVSHGAETAYLQVVASNAPAIALYRSLGFRERYRYHYRIAPAA